MDRVAAVATDYRVWPDYSLALIVLAADTSVGVDKAAVVATDCQVWLDCSSALVADTSAGVDRVAIVAFQPAVMVLMVVQIGHKAKVARVDLSGS